ncbi:hypothetical protein ZIOFF_019954 [Zingiber officinale]|uniref:MRG domain-containing protein n=1 Tax=Zingiber officinale TaxID=94328 RepID=A0A8J5HAH1_ZINOF|nr:hypothetical protein ZIOFF_019954 [Zingiber officinale]
MPNNKVFLLKKTSLNGDGRGSRDRGGPLMGSTNTGGGVKEETSTDGDGGDNAAAAGRNDASDPSGGGVFAEGEKVLAYHGPLIYEAKVSIYYCPPLGLLLFHLCPLPRLLPALLRDTLSMVAVTDTNWSKKLKSERMNGDISFIIFWDEWVPADRMLKCTEENIRKQQALEKNQNSEKNPRSGRSTQTKLKDAKVDKEDPKSYVSVGIRMVENVILDHRQVSKGKKRKVQSDLQVPKQLSYVGFEINLQGDFRISLHLKLVWVYWREFECKSIIGKKREDCILDEKIPENLVKLQFPVTLKKQLVDEWEFVTQMGKLVKLPRSPNVDEILKKYLDFQIQKDGMITESVGEMLKGLRCYFDKALPAMLLYKKERLQYHKTIRDDVSPSTVYGAEHLLRLFVKLPELLACVNMEEEALAKLQKKLLDILRFLQKNQSTFFLSAYDGAAGGADESDAK